MAFIETFQSEVVVVVVVVVSAFIDIRRKCLQLFMSGSVILLKQTYPSIYECDETLQLYLHAHFSTIYFYQRSWDWCNFTTLTFFCISPGTTIWKFGSLHTRRWRSLSGIDEFNACRFANEMQTWYKNVCIQVVCENHWTQWMRSGDTKKVPKHLVCNEDQSFLWWLNTWPLNHRWKWL